MHFDNNGNSPEKTVAIVIFLIFMLIMAGLAILGNHSRVFASSFDIIVEGVIIDPAIANSNEQIKFITNTKPENNNIEEMVDKLYPSMLSAVSMCRKRSDGKILYHKFCRNDKIPCEKNIKEYTRYIVKHSIKFNLDPYLPAAVAINETNLNAYAVGGRGEKSIFQLLPGTPWAKKSKFNQNQNYRNKCKNIVGHCQEEATIAAIELLSNALKKCKTTSGALSMYNGGKCKKESTKKYVEKVKKKMAALKTNTFNIQWCNNTKG